MHVLIVNTLFPPNDRGGAERSVALLADALAARGHRVTVLSTTGGETTRSARAGVHAVYAAVPNLYWPYDGRHRIAPLRRAWHSLDLYNPFAAARFERLLDHARPDVIHTNSLQGFSISLWRAARGRGVPIVHTLRDYYLTCARALRYRNDRLCRHTCLDCRPFLALRRRASAAVQGVVGSSRAILEHHLALGLFCGARYSAVIHNSAEPPPEATPRMRARAGPPLTLGYLGRLEPAKGIERLLDVVRRWPGGDCRLLVGGEPTAPYRAAFERRRAADEDTGRIEFLGWVDPDEFFARIDVLVAPSLWDEPLPRAVLEATSRGVAVIASRRGGIPELIEDGSSGLLFEPDDPGSLERGIDRFVREPGLADALGRRARLDSEPRTAARMVDAYLDAYRAVAAAR
jgi:glycosyltransferase involved in cell wall biosynthesis